MYHTIQHRVREHRQAGRGGGERQKVQVVAVAQREMRGDGGWRVRRGGVRQVRQGRQEAASMASC